MPPDLRQWHSIANINLSNITFENFEQVVNSLATLPNLKSLYVNLYEEAQVDLIMRVLPELEFLNGLPVDREALNESIHSESKPQKKHEVEDVIQEEEAEATVDDQPPLEHENSVSQLHSSHMVSGENDSQQQIIGQHMDTSELEAIAICYDNIRQMRRKIPNNNDFELSQKFDQALRTMMDKLSNELQKTKNGELKVRAAILAK